MVLWVLLCLLQCHLAVPLTRSSQLQRQALCLSFLSSQLHMFTHHLPWVLHLLCSWPCLLHQGCLSLVQLLPYPRTVARLRIQALPPLAPSLRVPGGVARGEVADVVGVVCPFSWYLAAVCRLSCLAALTCRLSVHWLWCLPAVLARSTLGLV